MSSSLTGNVFPPESGSSRVMGLYKVGSTLEEASTGGEVLCGMEVILLAR